MSSGVQTGNGTSHDEYNIRGIAHTNRKEDILCKDDYCKALHAYAQSFVQNMEPFTIYHIPYMGFPGYGHIVASIF